MAVCQNPPNGNRRTTTFVAGLRLGGIDAVVVIDGPMNAEVFLAYVRNILAPALRPDDVVVMDNLGCQKGALVREAIGTAEPRFLPPYLPDFNPIEHAFAKLKALLRKAATRNYDTLWLLVGRILDAFTPERVRKLLHSRRLRARISEKCFS